MEELRYIDLHTHSQASDGSDAPSVVVKNAQKAGLAAIALTDHDTMDGVREAIRQGKESGVRVVPGVEVSCTYGKKEVHVLGYILHEEELEQRIEQAREGLLVFERQREERNDEILANLCAAGMRITREDLYIDKPNTMVTRYHFAYALMRKNYVSSIDEAFVHYLEYGGKYVPVKKTTLENGMDFFHKNQMFISLAHPYRYGFSEDEVRTILMRMKDMGMHGVETYYSTHTEENVSNLMRLGKELSLLPTGGSDYHGTHKPKISIGTGFGGVHIPRGILEEMERSFRRVVD